MKSLAAGACPVRGADEGDDTSRTESFFAPSVALRATPPPRCNAGKVRPVPAFGGVIGLGGFDPAMLPLGERPQSLGALPGKILALCGVPGEKIGRGQRGVDLFDAHMKRRDLSFGTQHDRRKRL